MCCELDRGGPRPPGPRDVGEVLWQLHNVLRLPTGAKRTLTGLLSQFSCRSRGTQWLHLHAERGLACFSDKNPATLFLTFQPSFALLLCWLCLLMRFGGTTWTWTPILFAASERPQAPACHGPRARKQSRNALSAQSH